MPKHSARDPSPVGVALSQVRDAWHDAVKGLTNQRLLKVIDEFEADLVGAREAAEEELDDLDDPAND